MATSTDQATEHQIPVDGLAGHWIDDRADCVRLILERATALLFDEVTGGPRTSVDDIIGMEFRITPDQAEVDAATMFPFTMKTPGVGPGWIRFHFTHPAKVERIEFVERLAPGEYMPEMVKEGDRVRFDRDEVPRLVVKVEHGVAGEYPIRIHTDDGFEIKTKNGIDGGLIWIV